MGEVYMKKLYLVRGVPGCGKTTFAESICSNVVSADDYFMENGEYKFNARKLKYAHIYCQNKTESFMKAGENVAVANTFTRKWEMEKYYEHASKYGYMVFSVIVENRHGSVNVHNVPDDIVENMKNRFDIKL
jgi:predicted kinase